MDDALGRGFTEQPPHMDAVLITGSRIKYEEVASKWLLMEHCAEKGIPCFFWDLDFTLPQDPGRERQGICFIKNFPIDFMPEQYLRKVLKKVVYLASIVDYERAKLDIYNPVEWHGFFDWRFLRPIRAKHKYDVVYVGSTGNRSRHFRKWYSPLLNNFRVDVWGRKMYEGLEDRMPWIRWHPPANPITVPDILNQGRVCIQSAREIYRKLGWQTFRIGECIMAGCILVSPSDVYGIDRFIGKEFMFDNESQMVALIEEIMSLSYEEYVECVRYQRHLISGQSPQHRVSRLEDMIYDLSPSLLD
jgi:hypothetical protein